MNESLEEGAIGIGYPFLRVPITWIIIAVILTNTISIYIVVFSSGYMRHLNEKYPRILSGIIFISLGKLIFKSTFIIKYHLSLKILVNNTYVNFAIASKFFIKLYL